MQILSSIGDARAKREFSPATTIFHISEYQSFSDLGPSIGYIYWSYVAHQNTGTPEYCLLVRIGNYLFICLSQTREYQTISISCMEPHSIQIYILYIFIFTRKYWLCGGFSHSRFSVRINTYALTIIGTNEFEKIRCISVDAFDILYNIL